MPTTIRQIRHRVDNELLDTMEEDLQILRKLINIDVPIGRRSSEVASKLTVRTKKDGEMRAGFNINKPKEKQK